MGSETREGRKNAGREALDSRWPGDFGAHVPPGKCLLEMRNKVVGNMLKHWIADMLFASLMSSVQRQEQEGSEQWAPWPGCGCHSVAATEHCTGGCPLELIPSSLGSSKSRKGRYSSPACGLFQASLFLSCQAGCPLLCWGTETPSGEPVWCSPAPSSLPRGDVPNVEEWAALSTLREQKAMFERTHPGNEEGKSQSCIWE